MFKLPGFSEHNSTKSTFSDNFLTPRDWSKLRISLGKELDKQIMLHFPCPHCKKHLKTKTANAGKKTKCKCGRVFIVPKQSQSHQMNQEDDLTPYPLEPNNRPPSPKLSDLLKRKLDEPEPLEQDDSSVYSDPLDQADLLTKFFIKYLAGPIILVLVVLLSQGRISFTNNSKSIPENEKTDFPLAEYEKSVDECISIFSGLADSLSNVKDAKSYLAIGPSFEEGTKRLANLHESHNKFELLPPSTRSAYSNLLKTKGEKLKRETDRFIHELRMLKVRKDEYRRQLSDLEKNQLKLAADKIFSAMKLYVK